MHKVDQTDFSVEYGNCFSACIASIFELPIEYVPNYWEQTDDPTEYIQLVNQWLSKHCGYRGIMIQLAIKDQFYLKDVLCIAIGQTARSKDIDHAVVWRNQMIHDPYPSREGLLGPPSTFVIFFPLQPVSLSM